MWYLSSSVESVSLGMKPLLQSSFFSLTEWYAAVRIYRSFSVHSPISSHLGFFHVLAVVGDASGNTVLQISFWVGALVFFGEMPRRSIAGWYFFHLDCYLNVYSPKWDYQVKGFECFGFYYRLPACTSKKKWEQITECSAMCMGFLCRT